MSEITSPRPCCTCMVSTYQILTLFLLDAAPEEEWNKLLINGITVGKGEISPEELQAVIEKRIERTLIRTDGGSYEQRILVEYLKGIQRRAEEVVEVLQGKPQ